MKKILVSRTDGIGDLMLTTPLIRELKQARHFVAVLASPYSIDILKNNPDVDEAITYDKKKAGAVKKHIIEGKFDATIIVYPRFGIADMLAHCRIPEIIGTAYRWYSPLLFTKTVKMHRKYSEKHEADYNLELAKDLIGEKTAEKVYYYVTPEEEAKAAEYIEAKGLSGGFIIVHPGSKGSAWNLSEGKYAEIIDRAAGEIRVLVSGGSAEKEKITGMRNAMKNKDKISVMDEPLGIREFAAVIGQSKVVVSGSTGPMHLAAALGVKTLSFFPPDSIRPMRVKRWGPLGNMAEIIKPASSKLSPGKAMETIPVDFILDRLKQLMAR
jgi:heptosyltransferase III